MLKYVVFDLDETLGFFTELSIIWDYLKKTEKIHGQDAFDKLCELFVDDYFRPGIFETLTYLMDMKNKGFVKEVVLYTNNTGSIDWLKHIILFLEKKSYSNGLFDKLVPGFNPYVKCKKCRTREEKTYEEIIRCASIPSSANIIFFDDIYHHMMNNPNVKYIRVPPYFHMVHSKTIIEKIQNPIYGFGVMNPNNIKLLYNSIHDFHVHYLHYAKYQNKNTVTPSDIYNPLYLFLNDNNPPQSQSKRRKSRKKIIYV